jgi:glycosyltransferase involved in cell wall biosynthesis
MKLQILIPQYKETEEIIKPMLDSLVVQQSVDFKEFGVIIVNDGTDVKLSTDFLKSYPYQIDYYQAPHRGVSATRNTCLDYASADYVMFCDADDMFLSACGLYLIFREIDAGFDTLSCKFVEEGRTADGTVVYINKENDCTFVHGKIHRRQYLIDNDIRWDPNLTIHEDSYFNVQC